MVLLFAFAVFCDQFRKIHHTKKKKKNTQEKKA